MSTQNEWGLTERGFRRPTYTELLDALEYKARELFGSKANLTVRSPIGLFLRIFAWILNMLFSTIEDVYNSRFVDTAVGTSLYNLGKAIGLKLLSEQKSSGYLQITGTPGTIVPVGWLAGTVAGLQFVVMAQGEIGTGGTVLLPAQATTAGPEGNVAAGTVTVVINPGIPEGITAVTNPAAFDGGRARETDEEYRDRYYQSVDYAGGVNADAIRGEILQNVEGVYSAIVYENDTDETDSEGLPPHSIEAVVYGGLDSDVAQQIFRRKAAGIQTYGSTTVAVLSSSGVTYNIKFSRPTLVPVWIKVTDLETDANRFPVDGKDQIAQALIDYIGSDVKGGTTIGETENNNRLPELNNTHPGLHAYTLQPPPARTDPFETNIGRLFNTLAWGLELVHDQSDKILLWDDLDNAQGAVLDRYGENFGVARDGAPDAFYRLLIKVKMISLLSGGDIETVINAAATLFDIEPEQVDLDEVFPAKVWIYVDEADLEAEKIDTAELIAGVMKRIVAAGVGMRLFLRTYRRNEATLYLNTGAAISSRMTIRPLVINRRASNTVYLNSYAYELAHITIRPAY